MSALLGHILFLLQRENPLLNPAPLPLARTPDFADSVPLLPLFLSLFAIL